MSAFLELLTGVVDICIACFSCWLGGGICEHFCPVSVIKPGQTMINVCLDSWGPGAWIEKRLTKPRRELRTERERERERLGLWLAGRYPRLPAGPALHLNHLQITHKSGTNYRIDKWTWTRSSWPLKRVEVAWNSWPVVENEVGRKWSFLYNECYAYLDNVFDSVFNFGSWRFSFLLFALFSRVSDYSRNSITRIALVEFLWVFRQVFPSNFWE